MSGGHCACDISSTKHPVVLLEPTWERECCRCAESPLRAPKARCRETSRPLLHTKQEGLGRSSAETKPSVDVLQSSSCTDLRRVRWRESWLLPERYVAGCAEQEWEQERLWGASTRSAQQRTGSFSTPQCPLPLGRDRTLLLLGISCSQASVYPLYPLAGVCEWDRVQNTAGTAFTQEMLHQKLVDVLFSCLA